MVVVVPAVATAPGCGAWRCSPPSWPRWRRYWAAVLVVAAAAVAAAIPAGPPAAPPAINPMDPGRAHHPAGQRHPEVEGVQPGVEGPVMPQHRGDPPRQVHEGDGHQQLPHQVLRRLELGDGRELAQEGEGQGHGDELDCLLEPPPS